MSSDYLFKTNIHNCKFKSNGCMNKVDCVKEYDRFCSIISQNPYLLKHSEWFKQYLENDVNPFPSKQIFLEHCDQTIERQQKERDNKNQKSVFEDPLFTLKRTAQEMQSEDKIEKPAKRPYVKRQNTKELTIINEEKVVDGKVTNITSVAERSPQMMERIKIVQHIIHCYIAGYSLDKSSILNIRPELKINANNLVSWVAKTFDQVLNAKRFVNTFKQYSEDQLYSTMVYLAFMENRINCTVDHFFKRIQLGYTQTISPEFVSKTLDIKKIVWSPKSASERFKNFAKKKLTSGFNWKRLIHQVFMSKLFIQDYMNQFDPYNINQLNKSPQEKKVLFIKMNDLTSRVLMLAALGEWFGQVNNNGEIISRCFSSLEDGSPSTDDSSDGKEDPKLCLKKLIGPIWNGGICAIRWLQNINRMNSKVKKENESETKNHDFLTWISEKDYETTFGSITSYNSLKKKEKDKFNYSLTNQSKLSPLNQYSQREYISKIIHNFKSLIEPFQTDKKHPLLPLLSTMNTQPIVFEEGILEVLLSVKIK
jgi:hypothetical protein